jgi:hypothetical protein
MADSIREYAIGPHAALEMERRGLDDAMVRQVLTAPEQREGVRCLVRVFVDVDRTPAEVVAVYRTSKIAKYWRHEA